MPTKQGGLRGSLRNVSTGVAIPDSGISRWTFDDADTDSGTAIDSWGTNDGTINGATTGLSGITGYESGQAYGFDGTDDTVDLGDVYRITSQNAYTISAWASWDALSGNQPIIEGDNASGSFQVQLRAEDSDLVLNHNYSGGVETIRASGVLSIDTATFVGATWDGSTVALYRNDTQEGTASQSGTANVTEVWTVGAYPTASEYADATIDDPRVYNKALSSTEVSSLYNTGSISG